MGATATTTATCRNPRCRWTRGTLVGGIALALWATPVNNAQGLERFGGGSLPYVIHLEYMTTNFPFPDVVERSVDVSFPWPDTDGVLDSSVVSVNAVARSSPERRIGLTLSGGITYFGIQGDAERVGAYGAWLGGHAVLFSQLYELAIALEPAHVLGSNIGGSLDIALTSHLQLFGDVRLYTAADVDTPVRFERFVSANIPQVPLRRIEAFVAPPQVTLSPNHVRVLMGIKWGI